MKCSFVRWCCYFMLTIVTRGNKQVQSCYLNVSALESPFLATVFISTNSILNRGLMEHV